MLNEEEIPENKNEIEYSEKLIGILRKKINEFKYVNANNRVNVHNDKDVQIFKETNGYRIVVTVKGEDLSTVTKDLFKSFILIDINSIRIHCNTLYSIGKNRWNYFYNIITNQLIFTSTK
jgi:hypothetical protein